MSDPEPPASDGQPEYPEHPEQRGSLSRLRSLLRALRCPRGQNETIDALVATAATELGTPITTQERVLIGNVLKGHGRNAADVMVPRVDIVALGGDQAFPDGLKCK